MKGNIEHYGNGSSFDDRIENSAYEDAFEALGKSGGSTALKSSFLQVLEDGTVS